MRLVTVTKNEAGQRLDKLMFKYMNLAGKSFIYKMIRKKNITLNGKKCDGSEKLAEGDEIRLFLAEETIEKFSEVKIQKVKKTALDIVYEDKDVIFINKPAGMLSQKAKDSDESLVEYLIDYLLGSGQLSREELKASGPLSATGWTAIPAVWWLPERASWAFRFSQRPSRREPLENIISAL